MISFGFDFKDISGWRRLFQKFFLAAVILTLYIPLVVFILLSFNEASGKGNIPSTISAGKWGIKNYLDFFRNSNDSLGEAFTNSLIIALFSVPISLFIGVLTAINIWKNYGSGKKLVFAFCNISISSPDIVQAIAFLVLFTVLIVPIGFGFGFFTIILAHIAISIPYVVIFIYPKLNKLNRNLLFVAYDLKFGFWEAIINVIIPILFPTILGAGLLVFTISFDDFIITNLIRGSVSTITSHLYTMRTGIKVWSTVFGSLVIVVSFLVVFISNIVGILKEKNVRN